MKRYPLSVIPSLLLLLMLNISCQLFAQTFHGVSSSSANGGSQAGPSVTVIPPLLMQDGDLVVVYVQYRNNAATSISIGNSGGQTWNSGATTVNGSNNYMAIFWCRFNGTWTVPNPSFTVGSGTNAMTAVMYVFRPNSSASRWGVHLAQANNAGTGTTQTINSITTTLPRTVTIGFWGNSSTNTWSTFTGTGWTRPTFPVAANQITNSASGNLSHTAGYNIQTSPATLNSIAHTQSSNTNTGRTSMTWVELTNDECSGAINLSTGAPGAACSTVITGGSVAGATPSGVTPGCASGTLYDVWYSFTATSNRHDITIASMSPAALSSSFTNRQVEIYQGGCSGLSFVTCSGTFSGSNTLRFDDYSPGVTYYIRVIAPNLNIVSAGGFNICVTTTALAASPPPVFTGKSYTNITRPTGGVIANGDILEFRYNITVGDWSASQPAIYNARFLDTIPSGLSYVANSIRFETNEGFSVPSAFSPFSSALTDASGDDEAVYSGGIMRVNVGTLNRLGSGGAGSRQFTTNVGAATTPITDAPAGGGKISKYGRPNQYGSFIVLVVRYQVQVTAATSSIFQTSYGKLMYQTGTADVGGTQTTVNFPSYSAYVSENAALCQSSVGINVYSNGDFGSGTTRHDSSQLTIAPGYTWNPFTTGSPGDGFFAVVNNTSANGSTNKYVPIPDATNRVFSVWDIIGDHTNASNVDSGNFAAAPGTNGGYMAVVNAAYGINNAVQRTITGLCSDTYYEFSAWFKNVCQACSSDSAGHTYANGASFKAYLPSKTLNDSAGVSPDLTYTIDGVDYYTTGGVPYDRRWVKKGFLFRTGPFQNSVTLTIRNNAPGGGGNDWAIDDIGLATCLPRLGMRPSTTPTYCLNSQADLSVAVSTFYNNYIYYFWERSTDNGATWTAVHGSELSPLTYSYTNFSGEYRDTVALPSLAITSAMNGHRYRIRTATSVTNLSSSTCAVYNSVDVITINVNTSCDVLPTKLLKFNAQLNNAKTTLLWTAKEDAITGYEVERSADGVNFSFVGYVDAKGIAGVDASYSLTDPVAITGKTYYRLKLLNTSGNHTYSNIINVTLLQNQRMDISNLVNPFRERISFQLNAVKNEEVKLQLLDAVGHPVYSSKLKVLKGSNAVAFEVPQHLAKGTYVLRIVSAADVINKIIQKQ
jgi:trimeric autotransporter adhesin